MNKLQLSEEQFIQVNQDFIDKEVLDLEYFMVLSKTFVHKASEIDDCNMEYVNNNNIMYQEINRQGGTIVGFAGDVECIYFIPINRYITRPIEIDSLIALILDKGYTPTIDGNDVLINGYKVASWSCKRIKENVLVAIVTSVNVDLETIQNICTKPMVKVPKGLSEFGITTQEIKQIFNL